MLLQIDFIVGLHNGGSEDYNVSAIFGSLNHPQQFNTFFYNFSGQVSTACSPAHTFFSDLLNAVLPAPCLPATFYHDFHAHSLQRCLVEPHHAWLTPYHKDKDGLFRVRHCLAPGGLLSPGMLSCRAMGSPWGRERRCRCPTQCTCRPSFPHESSRHDPDSQESRKKNGGLPAVGAWQHSLVVVL